MEKGLFFDGVPATEVERLSPDRGPVDFVRLCAALIGDALREHIAAFVVPTISERLNVADGGVDAEYTTPQNLSVRETGGLIGPGRTVFQFKYRDVASDNRRVIFRNLLRLLSEEFQKPAEHCDRYVLMTNLHLSGTQVQQLRERLIDSFPGFLGKPILVWGASEIATAVNLNPYLRSVFFSHGILSTLELAEKELKAAYRDVGYPAFIGREAELASVRNFLADPGSRVLEVVGPRFVGKTRLVLEALREPQRRVAWAASAEQLSLELFRSLDMPDVPMLLVVDRSEDSSYSELSSWARSREHLKTILIREGASVAGLSIPGVQILSVGHLPSLDASRLIESIATSRSLPSMHQTWLQETAGGIPGMILHLVAVIHQIDPTTTGTHDLKRRLGALLYAKCAHDLGPEARRALEVASLLPVLGLQGEVGQEVEALCKALGLSPETLKTQLPDLEKRGLILRRGRFISVVPPGLAEYVASNALIDPERILAEFELEFESQPSVVLRFLERLRNVHAPEIQKAIASLISHSAFFRDLDALRRNARRFEILAPAAPFAAVSKLTALLGNLNLETVRTTVSGELRRILVWTLTDLILRSDTFESAARLLLLLAAAENETYGNNSSDAFTSAFHWRHPEVPVSLSRRLAILSQGADSHAASERTIVAAACGAAFEENFVIGLHHPKGPTLPDAPYRPQTWTEVREYAKGVLELSRVLLADSCAEVAARAARALLQSFRPFVLLSILPDGFDALGRLTLSIVGDMGRETPRAQVRADVVSQVELTLSALRESKELKGRAVQEAIGLLERVFEELTVSDFRARLWRWVGPPSWGLQRELFEDTGKPSSELEALASELAGSQELVRENLRWVCSDEAKQAFPFFVLLGRIDRGAYLLQELLAMSRSSNASRCVGAYLSGWYQADSVAAEEMLDTLLEARPDMLEGLLVAMQPWPTSKRTVDRLVRVITKGSIAAHEVVKLISSLVPWAALSTSSVERLFSLLDDGRPETRSLLLYPLMVRLYRGADSSPNLRKLAWLYLKSALPLSESAETTTWDHLAGKLGAEEPGELLNLLGEFLARDTGTGFRSLESRLPMLWAVARERARPELVRLLLHFGSDPRSRDWSLSDVLAPARDREVLLQFVRERGAEGARIVALNLVPEQPGFWEFLPELIIESSYDDIVMSRLGTLLLSGSWSGSAAPMITERIKHLRPIIQRSDSKVAQWAQHVEGTLQAWRERAERDDREDWVWDYRLSRGDLERITRRENSPERFWAISRLLKYAPRERVLELLTAHEILDALPKIEDLDDRTRRLWESYARYWTQRN